MLRRASGGALLVLAASLLATTSVPGILPAGDGPARAAMARDLMVNVTAVDCPPGYDNEADDDVCLAYDGQIPGPTWVFEEGQRVELTLNHRVAETISNTSADAELADRLTQARYTLHRHGVSVAACEDGVSQPQGTEICDSAVGPGGSVTYTFETAFPGAWHYHDHALGLDAGVVEGPVLGPEAEHRGLFGSFVVLPAGQSTDEVLDLHLLDTGPNGGMGLSRTLEADTRVDLVATGLGDLPWTVELEDDEGQLLWSQELGPGVSLGYTFEQIQPGTYTWTARTAFLPANTFTGTLEVTGP